MKRGFTLIEVLIATALLSLIVIFGYFAINTLKKSNESYERVYQESSYTSKLHKALFADILQSSQVEVVKKDDYDLLYIQTSNSHHSMIEPIVVYAANKNGLFRLESRKKIDFPPTTTQLENSFFEKITSDVQRFRVYAAKGSLLIVYNDNVLEFVRP